MNLPLSTLPERVWHHVFRVLCWLILLFLIVPILVIVPLSFNSSSFLSYPLSGLSMRWYAEFFGSNEWMLALKNSFIVAPLATLLATGFGTLAAVGLARGEFRGKGLVMGILISPMIVPLVIVAAGAYFFLLPLGDIVHRRKLIIGRSDDFSVLRAVTALNLDQRIPEPVLRAHRGIDDRCVTDEARTVFSDSDFLGHGQSSNLAPCAVSMSR